MAHLYLTRKQMQCQQFEALMASAASNNIVVPAVPHMSRLNSNAHGSASIVTSIYSDDNDVEDLEMLLEAYFMQLDGTRNKILSVCIPFIISIFTLTQHHRFNLYFCNHRCGNTLMTPKTTSISSLTTSVTNSSSFS